MRRLRCGPCARRRRSPLAPGAGGPRPVRAGLRGAAGRASGAGAAGLPRRRRARSMPSWARPVRRAMSGTATPPDASAAADHLRTAEASRGSGVGPARARRRGGGGAGSRSPGPRPARRAGRTRAVRGHGPPGARPAGDLGPATRSGGTDPRKRASVTGAGHDLADSESARRAASNVVSTSAPSLSAISGSARPSDAQAAESAGARSASCARRATTSDGLTPCTGKAIPPGPSVCAVPPAAKTSSCDRDAGDRQAHTPSRRPPRRARRFTTALDRIWLTRDSVTPRMLAISWSFSSSK